MPHRSCSRIRRRTLPFAALSLGLAAAACAPKKMIKEAPLPPPPKTAEPPKEVLPTTPPPVETGEAVIKDGGEFAEVPDLKQIRFALDNYSLDDAARSTLRQNADYLKGHESLEVLVTGNCDERGTTEYNVALGQRRAKAVRDYYLLLGVAGKSVATISYGKEKPLCTESNEACWAKNRRAETRVRSRTVSKSQAPGDTTRQ